MSPTEMLLLFDGVTGANFSNGIAIEITNTKLPEWNGNTFRQLFESINNILPHYYTLSKSMSEKSSLTIKIYVIYDICIRLLIA